MCKDEIFKGKLNKNIILTKIEDEKETKKLCRKH